ncbi:MAG: serine hydrolase [Sediminibacterium sp.]|nr:serine hydrolase [Sediminibacterium sp.]
MKIHFIRIFFFLQLLAGYALAQQKANSPLLDSVLQSHPLLKKVADQAGKYRLQIIYTAVTRDKNGHPELKHHYFNVNPQLYFYCASLIKLPTSIIALQKLQTLKHKGITRKTTMVTDSCMSCMNKVDKDTGSVNQLPSIEQYIKEMLLVSDNAAYSRVYEFCGTDLLNKSVKDWGCKNTYIINRYDGRCFQSNNFNTNPVTFLNADKAIIYSQPCVQGRPVVSLNRCEKKAGKAYYNAKNKLVKQAKDFEGMNECPLEDIHHILQKLVFGAPELQLTKDDHAFLMRYMALYPRESKAPRYTGKAFYDSFKKYLIHGDSKKPIQQAGLRIFNIVGQSYGFMSDCAYIVNFDAKTECLISVALYANEDEVINDGRYDYNTLALPFMGELGRSLLRVSRQQTAQKQLPPEVMALKPLVENPD